MMPALDTCAKRFEVEHMSRKRNAIHHQSDEVVDVLEVLEVLALRASAADRATSPKRKAAASSNSAHARLARAAALMWASRVRRKAVSSRMRVKRRANW